MTSMCSRQSGHAEGVVGKIDGIPYFYLPIDPATMDEFLEEFFMILNVAIGGTLGGAPDASTPWPQTMLVDYVRVYQEDGGNGTYTIGAPPPAPELGVYSETHTQSISAIQQDHQRRGFRWQCPQYQ